MSAKKSIGKPHTLYHRDGSIWAKGFKAGEKMSGYWEWFRKDGSKMRSGHFDDGKQVGTWTTYDRKGKVYKVTEMKPASPVRATKRPARAANGTRERGLRSS